MIYIRNYRYKKSMKQNKGKDRNLHGTVSARKQPQKTNIWENFDALRTIVFS